MMKPVAISTALAEEVVPTNPAYAMFFEALRAEGRRTQPIESLDEATLAPFGALLLGAPRGAPEGAERYERAVQRWIAGGGAVLHIAEAATPVPPLLHEIGDFTPGCLMIGSLGHAARAASDPEGTWRWAPEVAVDVSTALGRPATLALLEGAYFVADTPDSRAEVGPVLNAIPAPADAQVNVDLGYVLARRADDKYPVPTDWRPRNANASHLVFVRRRYGAGAVLAFGSARSLSDEGLAHADNLLVLQWLLRRWLPDHAGAEVRARMARPQRHRMLHGYPMAPLTPPIAPGEEAALAALEAAPLPDGRSLIVGVLPHPFCNPAVRGCGFCTFPHESFSHERAHAVAARVAAEVDAFGARAPALRAARVEAVYLGGGTANLTPADDLAALGEALARAWDLTGAEVTFEGVPVYFTARDARALDALERAFPASRRRLSLGVQTFDRAQLARMGRLAFGDRTTIEDVVRQAHARGMTVSADLLFDLPGQTLDAMLDDVEVAAAVGFDHLCLYHLVLYEGLGTEWSHDRSLLAALPDNARACANWIALRRRLLALGFVQTSLTNFERREAHEGAGRFRYEELAYRPEQCDILGFGPAALSLRFAPDRAVKLMNADGADAYVAAMDAGSPRRRAFVYGPRDARVLYLTRKVVTLGFARADYRALFGTDAVTDFGMDFDALDRAGLVDVDDARVALTERGMFYADSVAGLLASRQVHDRQLRERLALGRPLPPRAWTLRASADHMG